MDRPVVVQHDDLAAVEPDVDGHIRTHCLAQPTGGLRRVIHVELLEPAVALAEDTFTIAYPGRVQPVRHEERVRRCLAHASVTAKVVYVGV